MYQCPSFGESVVRGCRGRAKKAPPVPDARSIEVLEAHVVDQPPEAPPRPAWLSPVCWHRAFFAESALVCTVHRQKSYYKFVIATQSPLHAIFCKMEVVENYFSVEALSSADWDDVRSRNWAHTFLPLTVWLYGVGTKCLMSLQPTLRCCRTSCSSPL